MDFLDYARILAPELMEGLHSIQRKDPSVRIGAQAPSVAQNLEPSVEIEITFPWIMGGVDGARHNKIGQIRIGIVHPGDVTASVDAFATCGGRLVGTPQNVEETVLRNIHGEIERARQTFGRPVSAL